MQVPRSSTFVWCVVVGALATPARSQAFELLSRGLNGAPSNGDSSRIRCSANGRFVAFESAASNLVANDANGSVVDVFVLDRQTGAIDLASRGTNSAQSPVAATLGGISDDGRWVAFLANGLEPVSADASPDVYLRDRLNGTTIEATPTGQSSAFITGPVMAGSGRYVLYGYFDNCHTFVEAYDRVWGQVVPILNFGSCFNLGSRLTSLAVSADGDDFAIGSYGWAPPAPALVSASSVSVVTIHSTNPTVVYSQNGNPDKLYPRAISNDAQLLVLWYDRPSDGQHRLFAFDRGNATEQRLDPGAVGNHVATDVSISGDLRHVAYLSSAPQLVPGDTNSAIDAFRFERLTGTIQRLSESAAGQPTSYPTLGLALDSNFGFTFLSNRETAWVTPDTNLRADLFLRRECAPHYPDNDLDGFGASVPPSNFCLPSPAGWSVESGDCDDTRPNVFPGAAEVCNGLDDDCDGQIDAGLSGTPFCVPSANPTGCVPLLSGDGCLSASYPRPMTLNVTQAPGARTGAVLFSLAPDNIPLAPGHPSRICISSPRQRTTAFQTGGNAGQCDGSIAFDFRAWASANPGGLGLPLIAGHTFYFQGWIRESSYSPELLLSAGWSVTTQP